MDNSEVQLTLVYKQSKKTFNILMKLSLKDLIILRDSAGLHENIKTKKLICLGIMNELNAYVPIDAKNW